MRFGSLRRILSGEVDGNLDADDVAELLGAYDEAVAVLREVSRVDCPECHASACVREPIPGFPHASRSRLDPDYKHLDGCRLAAVLRGGA